MSDSFEELLTHIFLMVGVGAILYAAYLRLRAWSSQSWRKAKGTILRSSRVEEHTSSGDSGPGVIVKAEIEYEYRVDSKKYTGDAICIGGEFFTSFEGAASRFLRRYPEGKEVSVYYNPHSPKDCCLERRSEAWWLTALIGLGFIVFSNLI
ncbi:MAG: DUF3592 domain-containing protein [Bdellovibrionales bacterium]|nr:DUF3592 domain-containing protein [Bdellovibrionales bacterium]